ncbi:hypothetical protein WP50_32775 [Lactiplantibacillus plantarum]|nr:hypothetical protein WP50_32775 [Lactiplantibacillus plantarum]
MDGASLTKGVAGFLAAPFLRATVLIPASNTCMRRASKKTPVTQPSVDDCNAGVLVMLEMPI